MAFGTDRFIAYQSSLKHTRALKAAIWTAVQDGIEQGIEQGETKKALQIARKMKVAGMDIATIAEVTGLSEEKISKV